MVRLLVAALLSLGAASFQELHAQTIDAGMKKVSPPYIARTSNFMGMAFHLKATEVQSLLPAGVKVKIDDEGQATLGMEIYITTQAYGIPNYTLAFIYVTVNVSNGSINPSEMNYPIWGAINNEMALQNFKYFYNFPYTRQDVNITEGAEQTAMIGAGNGEGLTVRLKKKAESPVNAQGLAPLLNKSADGRLQVTEIPWLANGDQADVVSFEVRPGGNKVLQIMKGATPVYGQISKNAFSYARPISQ